MPTRLESGIGVIHFLFALLDDQSRTTSTHLVIPLSGIDNGPPALDFPAGCNLICLVG